jgi:hypothetical protein
VSDNQFDNLSLLGVPLVVSNYALADTIMLIGKRKRPYSPFPQSLQDELLGYWSDNELMGVIKLKPASDDDESWISKKHELRSIRGREEALDELKRLIEGNDLVPPDSEANTNLSEESTGQPKEST